MNIIDLLVGWIKLEYDVELKRQQLVSDSEDFNTIDAFRLLDIQGRGEVTLNDLKDILKNEVSKVNMERTGRGLEFSENELIAFIQRYTELQKNDDQ